MYPISADAFVNVKRPDSAYTKTICGHQTIFLVLLKTHYDLTGVKDITLLNIYTCVGGPLYQEDTTRH